MLDNGGCKRGRGWSSVIRGWSRPIKGCSRLRGLSRGRSSGLSSGWSSGLNRGWSAFRGGPSFGGNIRGIGMGYSSCNNTTVKSVMTKSMWSCEDRDKYKREGEEDEL
jgi:hypothetical protein